MGWSHIGYTLKVGRGQHELQDEQRVQSFIVMVDGHFGCFFFSLMKKDYYI